MGDFYVEYEYLGCRFSADDGDVRYGCNIDCS